MPSLQPSVVPSVVPSRQPTSQPSGQPHETPSSQPSKAPSTSPSCYPLSQPTTLPTIWHTGTLPLNGSISVFGAVASGRRAVVLPFQNVVSVGLGLSPLSDVVLNGPQVGGVSSVVLGTNRTAGIHLNSLLSVSPAVSYDFSRRSVSNAGDVNGDGHDDLIIGAPYSGRAYVLFGTKHGFVNMTEGFTILGEDADLTGWSVSGAGDVNNDTFADIIIGAPSATNSAGLSSGVVYVIFGTRHSVDIGLTTLAANPQLGFVVNGAEGEDSCGLSVSGAGDVNGDGIDDVIVGAMKANDLFGGAVYVLFGSSHMQPSIVDLASLKSPQGFAVKGPNWSWFGYSVSGAGDMNGDGFEDVIVGSLPRRATYGPQLSYLLFGHTNITVRSVVGMTASQGVVINGGGVVVSGAGDINGDGFADVMIGNYDVSSGGGFVMHYPEQVVKATKKPTNQPSPSPSLIPTMLPSTLTPSVIPSFEPSGPSYVPTEIPTQPTEQPSETPTAPSAPPSLIPSRVPSKQPTAAPIDLPSKQPSVRPSCAPTIHTSPAPGTQAPSETPSQKLSKLPTRYPVVYPTVIPTVVPTVSVNHTYGKVHVDAGGFLSRPANNYTNYIINATSDVTILGTQGVVIFTVLKNENTTLYIEYLNVTTDVIDLQAFKTIHSVNEITHTLESNRRLLRASDGTSGTLKLFLGGGQSVVIANISASDLSARNFRFAKPQDIPAINRMKPSYGPIIVASVVFGSLVLFIVFKFAQQLHHEYKMLRIKITPIDWIEVERTNPTYVSFNKDNSDSSLASNVSSLTNSSSDEDSSDEEEDEEEEEEDSVSTEHDSPQGSVLEDSEPEENTHPHAPVRLQGESKSDSDESSSTESDLDIDFPSVSFSDASNSERNVDSVHSVHSVCSEIDDTNSDFDNFSIHSFETIVEHKLDVES